MDRSQYPQGYGDDHGDQERRGPEAEGVGQSLFDDIADRNLTFDRVSEIPLYRIADEYPLLYGPGLI